MTVNLKNYIKINQTILGPSNNIISPTLILFLISNSGIIISTIGYNVFHMHGYLCFFINILSLHLSGTVIHDAAHKTANKYPLLNTMMGHLSALILGFSFPVFTRVHMKHHANVNDIQHDPDHFVSTGGPLWLIASRFFYHEVYFFQRKLWQKIELFKWLIERLIFVLLLLTSVKYNFLDYVLKFWFCPALIVGSFLGIFFDYLPHHPFKNKGKWNNSIIYPNILLNWLILGQNYHLVHHLWPSVPWYNYQKVYSENMKILELHTRSLKIKNLRQRNIFKFLYDLIIGIRLED
uniref:Fatty-acid desaturase n=1 Tax=Cyanidium sp. THAL103 TaxID=3027999 RepID=A0A9Y1I430_9RHOD|nr:fatty-acid desaturase [Cyanidium sp. THAL103]